MRYIKEGPFVDRKGNQVELPANLPGRNGGEPTDTPTIGDMLYFLVDSYEPIAGQEGLRLSSSQVKNNLWPALDSLEGGPNKKGFFAFDPSTFEQVKKIVMFYAERFSGMKLSHHAPILEELFETAGKNDDTEALEPTKPEDDAKSKE